jgi:aminobenzoyl-glutamate transport protein
MRALDWLERAGNALPHPVTLFVIFGGLVLLASWITARMGLSAIHPRDGSTIAAVNLLDREGVRRIFTEAVRNFTGFAPLGTVLVAMLGVGLAEATGLMSVLLRGFAMSVPRSLLTAAIVFAGVNGSMAGDAAIILLPPLAAMLFIAVGRHPLVGIAAAFAGVAGGFSANLMPTILDVLLVGLTQASLDASHLLPGYHVNVLGNYWFMLLSTPMLTVLGAWVTHRFVEPRYGRWEPAGAGATAVGAEALPSTAGVPAPDAGAASGHASMMAPLTAIERRGLMAAGWAVLAVILLMLVLTVPGSAPLRIEGATPIERLRPFFDSMVVWVLILFFVPGLAYGIATRGIRNDHDVAKIGGDTMATMGVYIVLAFAAGQFVAWFGWSNLGAIMAIGGANGLKAMGLQGAPLIAGLIVFSAILNLFTASSSAKWAVMSTVFVPMFVLLGFTPEGTQAIYRVGDSCTNMITPLMPYMPFLITYAQRYDEKAGTGTIISLMVPYTIAFTVAWTLMLIGIWMFKIPIGPGVGMMLKG